MRIFLEKGTQLRVPGGICYEIAGVPLGEGGGSIIYPVRRHLPGGKSGGSNFLYALKECYPVSSEYVFTRDVRGEVIPQGADREAERYLSRIKEQQLTENEITGQVYSKGFRLTPVLETFQELEISRDGGQNFYPVHNVVSIMESLSCKGQSLKMCLKENKHLTADIAFRIIEQLLYAVREVHDAGYLHLDIQDGNVFVKGRLDDNSGMVSLLDFGISRKRSEDGLSDAIRDRVIYSTPGFSAVEILYRNDGTLRLGPGADIYSIGCLLLLLLSGHRFSGGELYTNTTGRYLPRFSVRKTHCPRHLVERMQKILAKALANNVKDRYQNVDEMLQDVKEFLALLEPFRNPLSGMEYDAFICYKHGTVGTPAAQELRNALERHGRGIFMRNRPIRRVFLDEGELASCADFGERIRDALQHSKWLIVLCSRQTKESPWVTEEIKTFLEYHPSSHILAVVVEGEPEHVYPEILLKNGMDAGSLLAADARGRNLKEICKKIRGDVKLKIAAPILNTTYDNLKQRDKVYRWKRTAIGICLALLALTIFSGYAAVKSQQIAEQAVEITAQQRKALENQARYLLQQARKSYEQNDRFASVEQCLKAYGLLRDSEVYLPELYYLLAENLGLYKLPFNVDETVSAQGTFRLEEGERVRGKIFTDSDGRYLFAATPSSIRIWDTETFQEKISLEISDYIDKFDVSCLLEEQGGILAVSFYNVTCFDYETGSVMWEFQGGEKEIVKDAVVSEDGSLVAVSNARELYVLDARTGTVLQKTGLNQAGGEGLVFQDAGIAICPDNKHIACTAVKEQHGSGDEKEYSYRLLLYDLKNGKWSLLSKFQSESSPDYAERLLYFTGDGQLLLVHQPKGAYMSIVDKVYQYVSDKIFIEMELYDTRTHSRIWKNGREYRSRGNVFALDTTYDGKDALCIVYGSRCELLDRADGTVLDFCDTDSPVVNVRGMENKLELVLENGDLLNFSRKNGKVLGYEYFPGKLKLFYACGDDYYIVQREEESFHAENQIIRYRSEVYDERYTVCSAGIVRGEFAQKRQEAETVAMLFGDDNEAVSPDWRYRAVLGEHAVILKDSDGGPVCTLNFEEAPLSLYFLPDSSGFLICFERKAARYTIASDKLVETDSFGDDIVAGLSDKFSWHPVDSNTVILSGVDGHHSYMLPIPEESFGILCEMEDFARYDPEDDSLCFVTEKPFFDEYRDEYGKWEEVGKIKRYTENDIIEKARDFLDRGK